MTASRVRVFTAVTVVLLAAPSVRTSAQTPDSLSALTVPTERLPTGCRLEPVNPNATGAARFVMSPGVRQNPWVSTGRQYAATIREVVDGPARLDSGAHGPAEHHKQAEDVAESYRARYITADRQRIDVWAVRFKDPKLTLAASMNRLLIDPPQPARIVLGSTAVLVLRTSGSATPKSPFDYQASSELHIPNAGTDCVRAITEHISGLKLSPPSK